MKKILALCTLALFGFANVIDAIALVVNNEPITTYEIIKTAQNLHISKKEAIDLLIRKKLEASQIKKFGIEVSDMELDNALENIAKKNGLDIFSLEQAIEAKGMDWQEYKEGIKKQLLRQKLYKAIMQSQTKAPSEERLKEYYNTHKEQFSVAKSVDVVKYISPSKTILERIRQNPLYQPNNPALLQKGEEKLDLSQVDPQFATLLNQTPEGSFTQILPIGDKFLLLYVKKKEGKEYIPYEEAREYIARLLANKTGAKSVKEYFDRLKASAKIKIVRLP